MAFKLIARNTAIVPVKGSMTEDDGSKTNFEFTLKCKRLGEKAIAEAMKADEKTVIEFMTSVIESVTGLLDGDGNPMPSSPDTIALLLDQPGIARIALSAYITEQGAKAKN